MKFDPRTYAKEEEEGDLLTFVKDWTMAGFVCQYLQKAYPSYTFNRKDVNTYTEISVTPSPPNESLYHRMSGYARATNDLLTLFLLGG